VHDVPVSQVALQTTGIHALIRKGVAKLKKGDEAGGNADIAAVKAIQANIAEAFTKFFGNKS
jgi:hypothetical protein